MNNLMRYSYVIKSFLPINSRFQGMIIFEGISISGIIAVGIEVLTATVVGMARKNVNSAATELPF